MAREGRNIREHHHSRLQISLLSRGGGELAACILASCLALVHAHVELHDVVVAAQVAVMKGKWREGERSHPVVLRVTPWAKSVREVNDD